ncbi:unnamed protein product [Urochloa humidicola]
MGLLARSPPAATADEPVRLLLLALLACAAAAAASICDTASCGRGICKELPELIPGALIYECHCYPGWSHASGAIPFSPCIVPNCSFDGACLNLSVAPPTGIPKGACDVVSCGKGGACKTGDLPFSYSCECQPGYANLLNQTALPCVNNCFSGKGCSALGLGPAPASEPSPPVSPTPTAGDHDSSRPSAPPSGTKGSVPSRLLLQQLLLVTIAMAQVL